MPLITMANMSTYQRDNKYPSVAAREILLRYFDKYPRVCNIGEYCRGCGQEIRKNKGTINKQTGEEYPQAEIDHINNNNSNNKLTNLQLLCRSCNRIKNPSKTPSCPAPKNPTMESSCEVADSKQYRPTFKMNLQHYLMDNGEACMEEVLMNSEKFSSGGGRTACERYLQYDLWTKVQSDALFQTFPYNCGSAFCKGTHICLVGTKPDTLIEEEKFRLTNRWHAEYGDRRHMWKNDTRLILLPFMELGEYLKTHGSLLNYDFK